MSTSKIESIVIMEPVSTQSNDFQCEYEEIYQYLSEFQVTLSDDYNCSRSDENGGQKQPKGQKSDKDMEHTRTRSKRSQRSAGSDFKVEKKAAAIPSITVFKKKNLTKLQLSMVASHNLYEHNLSNPDIDLNDAGKSKVSCVRCRKFKKKCSRSIPECSNCSSSDELCIYLPRKAKAKKVHALALAEATLKPSRINDILNPYGEGMPASFTGKRLSMPNLHYAPPTLSHFAGSGLTSSLTSSLTSGMSTSSSTAPGSSASSVCYGIEDSVSSQNSRRPSTATSMQNYLFQSFTATSSPSETAGLSPNKSQKKHSNDFGIILN